MVSELKGCFKLTESSIALIVRLGGARVIVGTMDLDLETVDIQADQFFRG